MTTDAIRFDSDKRMWHLLPHEGMEEVIKVMEFGAKKYDEHNWRKGFVWSRCFNSAMRHLWSWLRGEDNDPESGISHMAHAATNCLFLLTYIIEKSGEDNRFKPRIVAPVVVETPTPTVGTAAPQVVNELHNE